MSLLYQVFLNVGLLSHTIRHEHCCENNRKTNIKPIKNLIYGPTILNIAAIDNIDFKESSFFSGNIFDTIRKSVHATVRLVF